MSRINCGLCLNIFKCQAEGKDISRIKECYEFVKLTKDNVCTEKDFEIKVDVIQPNHYKAGEMDVIAFCQYHNIEFDKGNVIKYVTRAGKKEGNSELQDLKKALEFLNRRIEFVKNKGE